MKLIEYQKIAWSTAKYPKGGNNLIYPCLGLIGESGELTEKFKKIIRDDNNKLTEEKRQDILMELSDLMWYVSAICSEIGTCLETLWEMRGYSIFHCLDNYDNNRILFKLNTYVSDVSKFVEYHCYENIVAINFVTINNSLSKILCVIEMLAKNMGHNIYQIADININKLQDRLERGVISGSGDKR